MSLVVTNLQTENRTNPLGIDTQKPRFSFIPECPDSTQIVSWRIIVASSPKLLPEGKGDLWDSGTRRGNPPAHIDYEGKRLKSLQGCFWKVFLKTNHSESQSEAAYFETGILSNKEWKGQWIAATESKDSHPAPLFRKDIDIRKPLSKARLILCVPGTASVFLDESPLSDEILNPAYTNFSKRCLYTVHDITSRLQPGKHCLGLELYNGFFNIFNNVGWDFNKAPWRASPRFRAMLVLEDLDGKRKVIPSDDSWSFREGPLVSNCPYFGETFDGRKAIRNALSVSNRTEGWRKPVTVSPPKGKPESQTIQPMREKTRLQPARIDSLDDGSVLYDFGQNITGTYEITVSGKKGASLTMLAHDNLKTLTSASLGKNDEHRQLVRYTHGGGSFCYRMRSGFMGFQYLRISGNLKQVEIASVEAVHFCTDMPMRGHFECSSALVNRMFDMTRWSYEGNFHGLPTDCPHREKNGWTGDAHLAAEYGILTHDSTAAYEKWIDDYLMDQKPDGSVPCIVPSCGWGYSVYNGPAWDAALILIPWSLYVYRGNRRILEKVYPAAKKYMRWVDKKSPNRMAEIGIGDWLPASSATDVVLTCTVIASALAGAVSKIGSILGDKKGAKDFQKLSDEYREVINRVFFNKGDGFYLRGWNHGGEGTQCSQAAPLYFNLADKENIQPALDYLLREIEWNYGRMDCGILGAKWIPRVLAENGHTDIAWKMLTRKDYPSVGYWMQQGATTLWESWKGLGSRNHTMYADFSAWMIHYIAGLQPDPEAVAFEHFYVRPFFPEDLSYASAEHESPKGRIRVFWKRNKGKIHVSISVPLASTATIVLPDGKKRKLKAGEHCFDYK